MEVKWLDEQKVRRLGREEVERPDREVDRLDG
jgi:hypothetical protein